MKKSEKIILIIQLLFSLLILVNFWQPVILRKFCIPILLIIVVLLILFLGIDLKKSTKQHQNLYYILTSLISYFIITYLLGIFIGFTRSIYSHTIVNLIKNIIPDLIVIILVELIRYSCINKSNKNKLIMVLTTILIILFESSYARSYYNLKDLNILYQYIGIVILSGISKNIFLTIVCYYTDYINPIIYRVITELYIYIVPIQPAFSVYEMSVINIVMPIALAYITVSKLKIHKVIKANNRKKIRTIIDCVVMAFLLIIVGLNSGLFKYQSLVIGSNSMYDTFQKGDVIIIEKLKDKENIKKGEVLIFKYDNKIIAHRVHEVIKKNNTTYYKTKGDNNPQVDNNIVETKDVIGIGKSVIRKAGYPSITLNEMMKG